MSHTTNSSLQILCGRRFAEARQVYRHSVGESLPYTRASRELNDQSRRSACYVSPRATLLHVSVGEAIGK